MASPRAALGDSHNFGRQVVVRGARVLKPRTVLWEWLLLARESPLRRALNQAAEQDGAAEAFAFLPSLRFYASSQAFGGEVERLELCALGRPSAVLRLELARVVGRALALFSWLGLADLHWENLVLGRDGRDRIVFGPLDVEMILADLSLPTETKLLPDGDPEYVEVCRHAAGVRRVLPYLGKPIRPPHLLAMAGAYLGTLDLLERHRSALAQSVAQVPGLRDTPIRVCLRGTDEYVRARSAPPWPPLLEAERVQLERGDIPYFFRFYGRAGLHYFDNRELTRLRRLPLRGDVPQLAPLLSLARGLGAPSRQKLRQDGLFTLLGAFDDVSLTGLHQNDELGLRFGARTLRVTLADGRELETSRNLRAFVGSVYLPCRCGEVRSVFVPTVTRCAMARAKPPRYASGRGRTRL
ncbi:MAG TPA: hypothetical protein VEX18_05480 [Polyangiaceae bacterium]|nr:hypothetical protein [Polyangiaceae bacterium]